MNFMYHVGVLYCAMMCIGITIHLIMFIAREISKWWKLRKQPESMTISLSVMIGRLRREMEELTERIVRLEDKDLTIPKQ